MTKNLYAQSNFAVNTISTVILPDMPLNEVADSNDGIPGNCSSDDDELTISGR